jgi:GTP cyclohydrolase II
MLVSVKVKSTRLMTNHLRKIRDLTRYGIQVTHTIPVIVPTNQYNEFHLHTKASKSGHPLDSPGKEHLQPQGEPTVVEGIGVK